MMWNTKIEFKAWRQSKDLSLKDLRDATGITVPRLSHIERGMVAATEEEVELLANELEVSSKRMRGMLFPPACPICNDTGIDAGLYREPKWCEWCERGKLTAQNDS